VTNFGTDQTTDKSILKKIYNTKVRVVTPFISNSLTVSYQTDSLIIFGVIKKKFRPRARKSPFFPTLLAKIKKESHEQINKNSDVA